MYTYGMKNKHYELYKEKVEEFDENFPTLEKQVGYDNFVDLRQDVKDFIKQTFIDITEGEIERLGKCYPKYTHLECTDIDCQDCRNYEVGAKIIEDQISYWKEAKALINDYE